MYTSGWPKNQKMCMNIVGSPPPAALKKLVPKWRSVSNVTAPANTGMVANEQIRSDEPSPAEQGMRINVMPGALSSNRGDDVDRPHDR